MSEWTKFTIQLAAPHDDFTSIVAIARYKVANGTVTIESDELFSERGAKLKPGQHPRRAAVTLLRSALAETRRLFSAPLHYPRIKRA